MDKAAQRDHQDEVADLRDEIIAQQLTLIAAQQRLIEDLQQRLVEQDRAFTERAAALEAQVRKLERQLLGPNSEKTKVPPVEKDLDEAEPTDEERAKRREEIAQKRRERASARAAKLETETVDHPVPEQAKQCPKCHRSDFRCLDFETSTTYEYVPGHFVRRVHRREKLACSCGGTIVTAPPVPKPISGGQYGYGFAAFVVVEKCADSLPIYRLEKRFERLGIPVSRATMNDLLHAAAEHAAPLVRRLQERASALDIVLADETSMRLQDRKERGFFWVFHGHDDQSDGDLALYVFAKDHSGETPAAVLGGTHGTLVVDGYTGYNHVTDPEGRQRGGCWCHLRRKLYEARKAPGDEADIGIAKLRGIFRVEHEAKLGQIVGTAEHLALRRERTKPIVDDFFAWAKETRQQTLPKSPLGEVLGYALNQRERLELFLTDPRIPPHNNASERRLRGIALGRKNYLFVGNPRAGRNLAALYSLVGSCISNGVEPTAYLTDVLPRISEANTDAELDALLPDCWQPPAAEA